MTDAVHPGSARLSLLLAFGVLVPGIALRISGAAPAAALAALAFGGAVVGAAFLLSWGAEVAQIDIPAGLAVSVIALIAVLPEYAVDAVFAIKGGRAFSSGGRTCPSPTGGESPCSLALANMTGGNRLLIGVGWSMVVFIAVWQWQKRRGRRVREIALERGSSVDVSYLVIACAYSLSLPFKRSITLVDTVILVSIFVAYTIRLFKAPSEEPHLVGPAAWMGTFPDRPRRTIVVMLLVLAAGVILLCAEPFAEALVQTGRAANIDEFLLVQWLAPLASEAPELLVAGLYAYRLNTANALGTLVSSKVNQWTLLVGTLPVAFSLAGGGWHGLPIVAEQREELLLTAAQSVFAVAVLASLTLTVAEAGLLLGLFLFQFVAGAVGPQSIHGPVKLACSAAYLLFAVIVAYRHRHLLRALLRDGFRTPWSELAAADAAADED
jgi:cation:H+ antiporter